MNRFPNPLTVISSSEFENSLEHIHKHGYSMPVYSSELKNASGITITDNYIEQDLRHSYLKDCRVEASDFTNAVFADSKCIHTDFKNIKYKHTNVEYCTFDNCKFIDSKREKPYIGTNFSFSNFIGCNFQGITISNSTLDSVSFDNTSFENVNIKMSTIENSKFQNCNFENVELCDLNLCFSEFDKVHMHKVSLPFYQLPYTFGGLNYFLHTDEDVYIGADEQGGSILCSEQYRLLLPDIINYYKYYEEYFPIANIYMACDELQSAYETITMGIEVASHQKDFRMLYFLCRLTADSHMFTYRQLQALYDRIYDTGTFGLMTDYEKKSYFTHLGRIRKTLLFNDSQRITLEFRMMTNIDDTDAPRLGLLIAEIEKLFSIFNEGEISYNIEMKHQCPWEIIYIVIANLSQIQYILNALSAIVAPADQVISFVNNCTELMGHLFPHKQTLPVETEQDQEIKAQQLVLMKQQEEMNKQQMRINQLRIENMQNRLITSNRFLMEQEISVQASYHIK